MADKRLAVLGLGAAVLFLSYFFVTSLFSHRSIKANRYATEACPSAEMSPFRVDQVVILLIDALTPQVAVGDANAPDTARFGYIRDRLFRNGNGVGADSSSAPFADSAGFVSVADAPTTTSQRLKAITTGNIPAFIEAGANFNADVVEDDNIIRQLNGGASVLGDDTWMRLFPRESTPWRSTHVYPSFDVRDLDTVDNGVLEHLWRELEPTPAATGGDAAAKLLVAHFLGVDHAGHSFHATHDLLQAKVRQLNRVLRNTTTALRRRATGYWPSSPTSPPAISRTLLVVMGDHGMTSSGDHGGGSPAETDTFIYAEVFAATSPDGADRTVLDSARGLAIDHHHRRRRQHPSDLHRMFRTDDDNGDRMYAALFDGTEPMEGDDGIKGGPWHGVSGVHQIDLVPTLAIMLGIPIPRANAGRVIPELLMLSAQHSSSGTSEIDLSRSLEAAMQCNLEQLRRMAAEDLPASSREAAACADETETAVPIDALWRQMECVSSATRAAFGTMHEEGLWAAAVAIAVICWCLVPVTVLSAGGALASRKKKWRRVAAWTLFIAGVATVLVGLEHSSAVTASVITVVLCTALTAAPPLTAVHIPRAKRTAPAAAAFVLLLLRMQVAGGNSTIVDEEAVVLFLFASALFAGAVLKAESSNTRRDWGGALVIGLIVRATMDLGHRDRSFGEVHMQPSSALRQFIDAWVLPWSSLGGLGSAAYSVFASVVYRSSLIHLFSFAALGTVALGVQFRVVRRELISVVALTWLLCLAKIETAVPRAVHAAVLVALIRSFRTRAEVKSPAKAVEAAALLTFPVHSNAGTAMLHALTLHLLSWVFFFAGGSQTIFTAIDWHAAFVGVVEYNMMAGAALVFVNTAAPFIMTVWCLREAGGKRLTAVLLPRLVAIQLFHLAATTLSLAKHRRHLMVWEIFMPYYVFVVGATMATLATALGVTCLLR